MTQSEPPRRLIILDDSGNAPANYSPAVRVGNQVFVAGMISMRDGEIVGLGDIVAQTRQVLDHVETALQRAGSAFGDIVRYRIYLTDMSDLAGVRSVLNERFGSIRPAGTLVAVSCLVHPDLKIEIDADAIVGSALES
ncbi:MAG TPA: Rid family hydrolase [Thermomicrobiales bacterium]|nr:Rid family hydrolase [Thermomicrobiales bacterium]